MSGTVIPHGGTGVCVCHVMCGTGIAYGGSCPCACYAMPGTGMAYGAICLRARCTTPVAETVLEQPTARPAYQRATSRPVLKARMAVPREGGSGVRDQDALATPRALSSYARPSKCPILT
eukprot:1832528-Rhodomonas_salina.1